MLAELVVDGPRTTRYRWFLLAVGLVFVGLGVGLGQGAALGLGLALLAFLWLGRLLCLPPQAGLTAWRRSPESAFEGDPVPVELVVSNRGPRAVHLLEVSDRFTASLVDRHRLLEPGPLPSEHQRSLRYRAQCGSVWGLHDCGPITLTTCDPMGLFHAETQHGGLEPLAVFPEVYDVPGLERLGARASLICQEATAGRSGQSVLNLGVRDYRPGDDLRYIHWPATARRHEPVIREREIDLHPFLTLLVDLDARHRAGTGEQSTLEFVVRTSASLVWSATAAGYLVQLSGACRRGLEVPAGQGQHHLAFALGELIRVEQDGATPLLELARSTQPLLPSGSTVVLLAATVLIDLDELRELLEELRVREVRPVLVCVDSSTFLQVDRWPIPVEDAQAARLQLELLLQAACVPCMILERSHEEDGVAVDLRAQLRRGFTWR
jgi:uncharacterized protein (DUF58 family)